MDIDRYDTRRSHRDEDISPEQRHDGDDRKRLARNPSFWILVAVMLVMAAIAAFVGQ